MALWSAINFCYNHRMWPSFIISSSNETGSGWLVIGLLTVLFSGALFIGLALVIAGPLLVFRHSKTRTNAKRSSKKLILPVIFLVLGLVICVLKVTFIVHKYHDVTQLDAQIARESRDLALKSNYQIFKATKIPSGIEGSSLYSQYFTQNPSQPTYPQNIYDVIYSGRSTRGYELQQYKQPSISIIQDACKSGPFSVDQLDCRTIGKNSEGGDIVDANGNERGAYYTDYHGTRLRLSESNSGGLSENEAIQILNGLMPIDAHMLNFEKKRSFLYYLW